MPVLRYYSSTAQPTTLTGSISAGATTIMVGATTGFPPSFPYTIAIDFGAATEELADVTNAAGTTLTVTRAVDGTSAQSHGAGAVVRHVASGRDFADFQNHQAATSATHGVAGTIVGTTDAQVLTNKTLTAPSISALAATGGATFSRTLGTEVALQAQVSGDTDPRLAHRADGRLTWGSGAATGDAMLYREAVGTMAFDSIVRSYRPTAANDAFSARVSGDTASRWLAEAGGSLFWGPGGAGAVDTNLYRSAAGTLKTDGAFTAVGNISASNFPSGAWSTYTPTWSADSGTTTLGNGTLGGRYVKIGRTVFYSFRFQWGTTTTQSVANGNWQFALPPVAPYAGDGDTWHTADAWILDSSASRRWRGAAYVDVSNNWVEVVTVNATGLFMDSASMPTETANGGSTTSVTPDATSWADGDRLNVWGLYESAS